MNRNAELREQRKRQEQQNLEWIRELTIRDADGGGATCSNPPGCAVAVSASWDVDGGGAGTHRSGAAAVSRPDETDDQWANDWEQDFEESTREWERFA